MKRRKFILSSGSAIGGGGVLLYSQVSSRPTVGAGTNIQTPSSQVVSESASNNAIQFTFDSFQIEAQNLPSGCDITVRYSLINASDGNEIDSVNNTVITGVSGTVTTGTGNVVLGVDKSSLLVGSNGYRLKVGITVTNSSGGTVVQDETTSGTFSIENQNAIPDSGLVHEYRFAEGSGSTFQDTAGDVDGSVSGATWRTNSGTGGGYLELDGNNDEPKTDSNVSISGTQNRTLIVWLRPYETGNYWVTGTNNYTGGRFPVGFRNNTVEGDLHFSTYSISGLDYTTYDGKWTCLAITVEPPTISARIDMGASTEFTGSDDNSDLDTDTAPWIFGTRFYGVDNYVQVDIGGAWMYNRVLSDSELVDFRDSTKGDYGF